MSHGYLAKEALLSANLIVGEITNSYYVCMTSEMGPDEVEDKVMEKINPSNYEEDVFIICDMMGGTPCNVALRVANKFKKKKISVLSGLSLPMIIEYAMSSSINVKEKRKKVIETGKEATVDLMEVYRSLKE